MLCFKLLLDLSHRWQAHLLRGKFQAKAKATLAQTEAEAKAEIMKTAATHDSKWELIMAESTKSSIKDEIVTVIILIPLILVFIRHGTNC